MRPDGRGFWVLDNMTPLRALANRAQTLVPILFPPQLAYRLRRDNSTDTPLPPEIPAAKNPPDGAMIDYYLAADATGAVTLEIFTSAGSLVRRYASDDKPEPFDEKEVNVPTEAFKLSGQLFREELDLLDAEGLITSRANSISAIPRCSGAMSSRKSTPR